MDKLKELKNRRDEIISGGASVSGGKLSARERISLLFDNGSFIETDMFSGRDELAPGQGVITGYGTVDQRLVYVYAQDSSVKGGAFGAEQAKKICKIADLAIKTGAPLVGLFDSFGIKVQEGLMALSALGELYQRNIKASGVILQISAIMGPCDGGTAYSPAMSDFVFMTENASHMLINGPSVCSKEGKAYTIEELGGAKVHAQQSGTAHFLASDDADCISKIRKLLTFLPSNNAQCSPEYALGDDLNRLSDLLNQEGIEKSALIKEIADNQEFLEVFENYAKNIITGFVRINGRTVSVVANNGSLDMNAANKAARFIRFADSFNIPIVTFTNVEGFVPDASQEQNGLIRNVSKLVYAYGEATVPKVTVITGKAYGSAAIAMGSRACGADYVLSWPETSIGAMSGDMAAILLYGEALNDAKDPVSKRAELKEQYEQEVSSAFEAAKIGFIDDIIEPETTRPKIAAALEMLYDKREDVPCRKHGNISL
ncbi:MAG: acyl-CoA carboxylase subunit beta [Bacillota bacterium]|nr:acyl-CoA carboxylase subunit beta [Bacillota bacterium]